MEPAAPPAAIGDQPTALAGAAGCPDPELQRDAISFGRLAVGMEHPPAGGVGARYDPLRSCHGNPISLPRPRIGDPGAVFMTQEVEDGVRMRRPAPPPRARESSGRSDLAALRRVNGPADLE